MTTLWDLVLFLERQDVDPWDYIPWMVRDVAVLLQRLHQAGYDYLNVSLTLSTADDRFSVRVYGTNLLDRAVLTFASTNTTQYTADYGNPPRLIGAKVTYRF